MDLAANTVRWMKSYKNSTYYNMYIEGLALNPAEDRVAVYARDKQVSGGFEYGAYDGILFVIESEDGGYVTKNINRIAHAHSDMSDEFFYLTSSDSMYFTSTGKVLITWWLSMGSSSTNKGFYLNSSPGYDGRLRLAQFNVASSTFDWYYEQIKWFGQSVALAYGNWGTDDIFLGGAVDDEKY